MSDKLLYNIFTGTKNLLVRHLKNCIYEVKIRFNIYIHSNIALFSMRGSEAIEI